MNKFLIAIPLILSLIFAPVIVTAKSSSYSSSKSLNSSHSSHKSSSSVHSTSLHGGKKKASGVARDKKGKIARSAKAKDSFRKHNPCPSTGKTSGACPGYVIDHITPLKRGGADEPTNMQWQTKAAAKAKDKWE
jgi:hypothetical protein